jgi:hypothetical protein
LPPFRFSAISSTSWLSVSPKVADRFLAKASDDLRNFLAGFLNGLALSGRRDIYERILESELESARNLAGLARHLRYSDVKKPDFAARLLKRAIDKGDPIAVSECLLFALEHYGTEKIADADTFVRDAWSGRASRCHSKIDVAWCRIA